MKLENTLKKTTGTVPIEDVVDNLNMKDGYIKIEKFQQLKADLNKLNQEKVEQENGFENRLQLKKIKIKYLKNEIQKLLDPTKIVKEVPKSELEIKLAEEQAIIKFMERMIRQRGDLILEL